MSLSKCKPFIVALYKLFLHSTFIVLFNEVKVNGMFVELLHSNMAKSQTLEIEVVFFMNCFQKSNIVDSTITLLVVHKGIVG